MKNFHRLLTLTAALVLAGCATALPPLPAAVPTPPQFKEQPRQNEHWTIAQPAEAQTRGTWWKAFNDPVLDDLAERAAAGNTSIHEAAARLAQARSLVRGALADRLPQIGVGADASRGAGANTANGANGATPATLLQAGVNLSYELDLFGRLAGARDAAALDAQSREALLQSTRLLVQAEVAQTYLALRAVDTEHTLVQDTAAAYADTLRLTHRRFEAGDVAELDVIRIQTELAATEAEGFALGRSRSELEHALAVLVGEPASGFTLAPADAARVLPVIPAGVPGTVLTRRPDVAAAQAALLAAQARVGVAQAAWFPSVSLTAAAGYASPDLGDLFKWSARAWGVGALLSAPLFDGGRREAGVQGAQAQLDAAAASYRGQVLTAFREVEDQLSALRWLQDQSLAQGRAVSAAQRASAISETRYRNGLVSQLELLDARRNELINRRQAQRVEAARQQATVRLIRAIGGGWESGASARGA